MKILFATHNPSKLNLYKNMFRNTNYEILGLEDLKINYEVKENGNIPEENAIKKAKEYSKLTNYITIADDTGLFLEGIQEEFQPKNNVKRINGKALKDEELIDYYSQLFRKHGGKVNGKWIKSIAIAINDRVEVYNYEVNKTFVDQINPKRNPGFPLDSISITPEYKKYTVDLSAEENEILIKSENERMFKFILKKLESLKREFNVFIACPISKYLTNDGIEKEFEMFIKEVLQLCRKYSDNVFLALEREKYGKLKMWGDTCTPHDFEMMCKSDLMIAIPEDSMGVAVEMGWASAMKKEILLLLDVKYKSSELIKFIHTVAEGEKININTENGYLENKESILKQIQLYLEERNKRWG